MESGLNPLAIGVNGVDGQQLHPRTEAEAISTATRLISIGRNVDLGLAQINSGNLRKLGLTVADAFNPCRNLAAGARVLKTNFDRAMAATGVEQAAVRTSLSLYNTGDAYRGFRNGYVAKVVAAAGQLVPTIQPDPKSSPNVISASPPAWDVFARPSASEAGFVLTPIAPDPVAQGNAQ